MYVHVHYVATQHLVGLGELCTVLLACRYITILEDFEDSGFSRY